jgi:carbon-monoxide dehydrogenase large subunit
MSKKLQGIGASVLRKEDDRYMRGRGQFVGDIKIPGMLDVAFVRSPIAHGFIKEIHKPEVYSDRIFTMDDLPDVKPIRAVSGLPGFKASNQWPLAKDKVRQVGELIAACLGPTRASAEDLAQQVYVDFEELPAVVDSVAARKKPPSLVHDEWGDNIFLETIESSITRTDNGPFFPLYGDVFNKGRDSEAFII